MGPAHVRRRQRPRAHGAVPEPREADGRPTGGKPEHMAPREGLEDKSRDSVGRDCPSVSFELG